MTNALEILQKTKQLISNPETWCQNAIAQNDEGWDITAPFGGVKFCAIGAMWKASSNLEKSLIWDNNCLAAKILRDACIELYGCEIISVNDELGHGAVIQALDLAIEKAKNL